jgi:hypothetical protein
MKHKVKSAIKYFAILFILLPFGCNRNNTVQCNDHFALNFDKQATHNTECRYQAEHIAPKLITPLDSRVNETSGLAFYNNLLFTHNDQNNSNHLFVINTENGSIIKEIEIEDAANKDWEDLAISDKHLFIGDMGNNNGNRKDLGFYLIDLKMLETDLLSIQTSGFIGFEYSDQKVFDKRDKHNFDCEALIYYENHLYIFTKHRSDKRTKLYRIPSTPGVNTAELIDSFEAGGKITGAAVSANKDQVVLIGYNKKSDCFVWVLSDFSNDNFLSGKKKKIFLGPFNSLGQMEAIEYKDKSTLWITSEKTESVNARLYELTGF